jgi:hypothetical protein
LARKAGHPLPGIAHQPKPPDATAIGEADMLAIRFECSSAGFVLD